MNQRGGVVPNILVNDPLNNLKIQFEGQPPEQSDYIDNATQKPKTERKGVANQFMRRNQNPN